MRDRNERLQDLVKPKTSAEAYFGVSRIMYVLKDYVRIYTPHAPIRKLMPGMEARKNNKKQSRLSKYREDNLTRSVRRSKRRIKDIVDCNDLDQFHTYTFDPSKVQSRYDPVALGQLMTNWFKETQKKFGKFPYLLVMEYHKDGAVHFHALVNNYPADMLADSGKTDDKGRKIFNIKNFPYGFTTVIYIDDIKGAHAYLTKYIQKAMPYFKGKRRFRSSHGFKRPKVIYNPGGSFGGLLEEPFINDHGITTFHSPLNIPIEELVLTSGEVDSPDDPISEKET